MMAQKSEQETSELFCVQGPLTGRKAGKELALHAGRRSPFWGQPQNSIQ